MPYTTLFPGQDPNEKIILVLRRHWWVMFKIILFYLFLTALPLIVGWIIFGNSDSETLILVLKLLASIYYFALITFFYHAWLDYYLDIWVVTSDRVVNIEQKGLFSRHISTHKLYRIQDVTAEVKGIIPTFLHFGTVHVQTAGSQPRFEFKQIPNPYDVTKTVIRLVNWKKRILVARGELKE